MIYLLAALSLLALGATAALLYLRVPLIHSGITLVAMNLLIYLAFVKFLGVKLPAGLLF